MHRTARFRNVVLGSVVCCVGTAMHSSVKLRNVAHRVDTAAVEHGVVLQSAVETALRVGAVLCCAVMRRT